MTLRFRGGTIELHGDVPAHALVRRWMVFDARTNCLRAEAFRYRLVRQDLEDEGLDVDDAVFPSSSISHGDIDAPPLRAYQEEAVAAWNAQGRTGLIVLPTGAGKTRVGIECILQSKASTLVVAPTLDLVWQWHATLRKSLGREPGVVGGGDHRIEDVTVITYDSAYLKMERLGNRFGLIIFDEAHHLPGESIRMAASMCASPYRLGLTATPDLDPGREQVIDECIGPTVYRVEIDELRGEFLSEYDVETVEVAFSPDEEAAWRADRETYLAFLRAHRIAIARPDGFVRFIQVASSSGEGRLALAAYRRQRALAECAPGKLAVVDELLTRHADTRSLVFTRDNKTAYDLGQRALIPVITHQTKVSERTAILDAFRSGVIRAIATSRVLNEGVDVPDAEVAIVVSGSGTVREHVQRLGRVLRPKSGKRARLYELITTGTGEESTSRRRREHVAYR